MMGLGGLTGRIIGVEARGGAWTYCTGRGECERRSATMVSETRVWLCRRGWRRFAKTMSSSQSGSRAASAGSATYDIF